MNFTKTAAAIALGAACAMPVMAQTSGAAPRQGQAPKAAQSTTAPETRTMGASSGTERPVESRDDEHGKAWLGLLGLLGLLGMRRKNTGHDTRTRTHTEVHRSGPGR